ncbi:MAG: 6-phosphofructokinase [Deltaproteobacteria bacterium]|nr:6-phosphofructokinase [Deltaproteobacteria bacterium]
MSDRRRIGILTGGGDCPGLNAVIRAVVRTVESEGEGIELFGIRNGFWGLIADVVDPLGPAHVSGILPRGGTILGSSNRDNPFDFKGVVHGETLEGDIADRVLENAARRGLEGVIVIGGDGTQDIGHRLSLRSREVGPGLGAIGVPKTIDNDLMATDRTFGFDTAVGICSEAIDRIHTTAESHHRVMFVEVMGRHAGWIALHAGLAAGGDVILIPEIPFSVASVAAAVEARRARGKGFSIVVVAEGAVPQGGDPVYRIAADGTQRKSLGGIARIVAEEVERLTGLESRTTILGHVQRGGTPSAYDRVLASRFGVCAAREAIAGRWGTLAALRGNAVVPVPLSDAAGDQRLVDPHGEMVSVARATGVRFGDELSETSSG